MTHVVAGLSFAKFEALGNDFVVVDERDRTSVSLSIAQRQQLCDRHFGVGADGIVTLLSPAAFGVCDALVSVHFTNADGTEPENCGNGLRVAMRYLDDLGLLKSPLAQRRGRQAGRETASDWC